MVAVAAALVAQSVPNGYRPSRDALGLVSSQHPVAPLVVDVPGSVLRRRYDTVCLCVEPAGV